MKIIAVAVLSIFLLIVLGFFLRQRVYRESLFWNGLDHLTYFVLMPCMLFYQIAAAKINTSVELFHGFWAVFLVLLVVLGLLLTIHRFHPFSGATLTSIAQGSIRFNSYIFLAIVGSVYGQSGLLPAAFIMALMIPLINIIVVSVFAFFIRQGHFSWRKMLINMMKNPLIIACLLGLLVNRFSMDKMYLDSFKMLGNAAIATGLISIGAGLHRPHIRDLNADFWLACVLKLLVYPVLTFFICTAWQLNHQLTAICTLYAALPTATSSYILAKQMGGDKHLMSLIVTLQTLISPFSLALMFSIFPISP